MTTYVAEISVVPIGLGSTSTSRHVAVAVKAIKGMKGVRCEVGAMGTLIEADSIDAILGAVKAAHEALGKLGVKRISSTIKIDESIDKPRGIDYKIGSYKRQLESLK